MASPLPSSKSSVDLSAPRVRVSRIRRDPPPKVKEITQAEIREQDAQTVAIGVVLFALALFVVLLGLSNVAGWSPSQVTIHIEQRG